MVICFPMNLENIPSMLNLFQRRNFFKHPGAWPFRSIVSSAVAILRRRQFLPKIQWWWGSCVAGVMAIGYPYSLYFPMKNGEPVGATNRVSRCHMMVQVSKLLPFIRKRHLCDWLKACTAQTIWCFHEQLSTRHRWDETKTSWILELPMKWGGTVTTNNGTHFGSSFVLGYGISQPIDLCIFGY